MGWRGEQAAVFGALKHGNQQISQKPKENSGFFVAAICSL